ncbi:MAG: leucyl/phenylalanyl-tRNA--protein transferase [Gammaproteobacteria bacterium]|nr:leucyl/phenylalanyl-tRNA--protein transferase [Gammaproteobacteria bacterium]MDP2141193.1 leucyl/phenylalanyl-tRNA--protein transferase [Gammaproteobacteria bacterium]MDP2349133.1 leucyl/phenylalanyl-tRNA--protein transferase [Gammaproteobacteria bacterium]
MLKAPWLSDTKLQFPSPSKALKDPDGLLAIGGDLHPERLQCAYAQGIFPWYQDDQPILWWSPSVRMVLFPEELKISSSMRKLLRSQRYRVTFDNAFSSVIQQCAGLREEWPGTWITPAMQAAYCQLHDMHIAHSVEVWEGDELVGGLYGIAMGQLFFGESMFSLRDNASKVALIMLTRQLQRWCYHLIDCQVPSAHLRSMGAKDMPRKEFLTLLDHYRAQPGRSGRWTMELSPLEL